MPHVIVKLYSGKSERQKQALALAVADAVTSTLNYGEESVSVGIEDVEPKGLDRERLQAGHHRQAGHHLQEARI
ncbi:tautomerase family protein [Bradyrhizobium sp. 186]|uniref:tautomerase family protein n=1 Tax=Bradyrhizobium sp. 186 TaxID=2782654 RepID=UPI00321193A9